MDSELASFLAQDPDKDEENMHTAFAMLYDAPYGKPFNDEKVKASEVKGIIRILRSKSDPKRCRCLMRESNAFNCILNFWVLSDIKIVDTDNKDAIKIEKVKSFHDSKGTPMPKSYYLKFNSNIDEFKVAFTKAQNENDILLQSS